MTNIEKSIRNCRNKIHKIKRENYRLGCERRKLLGIIKDNSKIPSNWHQGYTNDNFITWVNIISEKIGKNGVRVMFLRVRLSKLLKEYDA